MRVINTNDITNLVERLSIEANCHLTSDIYKSFGAAINREKSTLGKEILSTLIKNADIAKEGLNPICQDTGMTVVFVTMGQDISIQGGYIEDAINMGVRRGYDKGFLRKSVVKSPIGSENMSQLKMLKPSQGVEGVKEFVIKTVSEAGANPCPPIIVGVGIGGTMEKAALLSKKALLRPVGEHNSDQLIANLEKELLESINKLGIGPAGFGGSTTALSVNILTYATHIAGLPVSVNIGCHATRHAEGSL
jgi:fumarate hydratase subunit alpha